MKQAIRKITQFKIIESFIQTDFVKGFKYVDKAGEIVNSFYNGKTPPRFEMNLSGLVIVDPDEQTKEIKVSPLAFWAHYLEPDTLDRIASLFEKKLEVIFPILSPEGFQRLGWRNYFIYEVNNEAERGEILAKFLPVTSLEFNEISLNLKIEQVNSQFSLKKVLKKKDPKAAALLFDTDNFIRYEEPVGIDQIKSDLRKIRESFSSEKFMGVINTILGKK
ncbi:hypothetical protein A2V80_03140 [Candidatus Woesebacteria bacterium RBG_16_39_8b]|uniref:Uncharacterized protein n=2 Tax=Microgenomates group TaxID=1794810 RepID=A0A1F7X9K7_9BACT|nr:MAG: hypothetical protein A2V80_03140 [Candidatus Woesebacteria bacterium RBG_16_39_8b]OGY28030.1 MAG: hypothetical protein A2Z42_02110 [Candidatus Woykebacteria bacterium RBG_19FT_COMBO_43_10]